MNKISQPYLVASAFSSLFWFLAHCFLPRSRQFRVSREVSCTKTDNRFLYQPLKDWYCCLMPLQSPFGASGDVVASTFTHGNIDPSYSWLALELTYKVICTFSFTMGTATKTETKIWKLHFPMIFNPKTAITTIIALAICQALCCAKYYTCILFLNLLKNLRRQKISYRGGNGGLGKLK